MYQRIVLGLLACLGLVSPATAQALADGAAESQAPLDTLAITLRDARSQAIRQSPALRAAQRRVEAVRGGVQSARTYPYNPELEVDGLSAISDGSLGRYEARIGQEIEWAGQRGLRIGAAEADLRRSESEALDETRRLLTAVERGYFALAAADRRVQVAQEMRALNQQLLEAVRVQLREGEISLLQANLAEIETGRGRARVLAAESQAASASLALSRLLGLDPSTRLKPEDPEDLPAPPDPALLGVDQLVTNARSARPDLRSRRADFDRVSSLSRLTTREAIPNLRVSGIAEREATGTDPRFGISVAIPVPLFARNQGPRARVEAEVLEAESLREAVELEIVTAVVDAVQAYQTASREEDVLATAALAPARENQMLLEIAYREGKLDLASVLLIRNQLLDAELEYWDAWQRRREAHVELRSATAIILDDSAPPSGEEIR